MGFIFLRLTVFSIAILFTTVQIVYSLDFGVVMDVAGSVSIERDQKSMPADLGLNLISGDNISIDDGANIVIVSYSDCMEWAFTGADKITIESGKNPQSMTGKVEPVRKLPVCYSPEDFKEGEYDVMGGIALRGLPKDPLGSLRDEFKKGNAPNSTLMTLIIHDLRGGKIEQAKPYYETLKKRMPESEFVKKISKRFENKKSLPQEKIRGFRPRSFVP